MTKLGIKRLTNYTTIIIRVVMLFLQFVFLYFVLFLGLQQVKIRNNEQQFKDI